MITLIGTNHLLPIKTYLYEQFDIIKPDLICVELDENRYHFMQKSLKQKHSLKHNTDMAAAITYAIEKKIRLELIDKPEEGRFIFSKLPIPFKSRIKNSFKRFFYLIFILFFPWMFTKIKGKNFIQSINNDLHGSENISNPLNDLKKKGLYKQLIEERDDFMSAILMEISENNNSIVAIVGDLHIEGISTKLKNKGIQFKAINLHDYYKDEVTFHDIFPKSNQLLIKDLISIIFMFYLLLLILT